MNTQTAAHIINRMPEVEKLAIYRAEPGRLEYLRQVTHGYGLISEELMLEIQASITARMTAYDSTLTNVPSTWKW